MSRSITVHLDSKSIGTAINKLQQYVRDLETRRKTLQQRIADLLEEEIREGFAGAVVEEFWPYSKNSKSKRRRLANVTVRVQDNGDTLMVIADGEDAVWVEFGTGVYYNTPVGTSPNPLVEENGLPYRIGTYGYGNGAKKVWFYNENGTKFATHGIEASMPMFNAISDVTDRIEQIAREVFSDA